MNNNATPITTATDGSAPLSHLRYQMWNTYLTTLNTIWDLKELTVACRQKAEADHATTDFHGMLWDRHLLPLNQAWHVSPAMNLTPPTSLAAKVLFPLKKLVVRWMQPFIESMVQQQNDVNARLVQTCNAIVDSVNNEAIQRLDAQTELNSRLVQALNGLVEVLDGEFKRLRREYEELQIAVWTFERRKEALEIDEVLLNQKLEQVLSLVRAQFPSSTPKESSALPAHERQTDFAYTMFEQRFRGDETTLKQRQADYVQYFQGCQHVLDIGCGRGEFLELLREHQIQGVGVDQNQVVVQVCCQKGLHVEEADVISYLERLDDTALDGIFIAQMVEHCTPQQLAHLLRLCAAKLQPQRYLVIETQNPTSLYALSHFHRDLSHEKPVHPDALEFLLKTLGFQDTRIIYTAPFPKEHALQELALPDAADGLEDPLRANLALLNQNIRQLNGLLYGHLDYAIVARKVKMV